MITIIYIWLTSGAIISGPIPAADCARHLATAEAAITSGGYAMLTEDGAETEVIARIQCDGQDVVLALPATEGDCEVGA